MSDKITIQLTEDETALLRRMFTHLYSYKDYTHEESHLIISIEDKMIKESIKRRWKTVTL